MKKENRKMTQEKRAAERKKQEERKKRKKFLSIVLPVAAIVILLLVLIADSMSSDSDSSADTSSTEASSYLTDTSLTVEDGDTVNIDYVGSIDGVEFDGGNTQGAGADLVIGSGMYIDDFEEQLIGAHPGDEVDVIVTFPEDYGNEELNGKEALFEVTVNGIYE